MPAARSAETAARLLIEALGSAASCVTTQRLAPQTGNFAAHGFYEVAFPGAPVSLRSPAGGPSGLLFDVVMRFAIVEAASERERPLRHAATLMYEYRLLDRDERELLVYHWQPGDAYRGPDDPHLHVSAALTAQTSAVSRQSIDLDKLHLATGHVSFPAVVRMLIEEFRIASQRPDWARTLNRAEGSLGEVASLGA